MIEVRRLVHAPPSAVWAVLSNGWLYPSWVVGASRMRAVDPAWPRVGARLHHSVGAWPLLISDSTSVVESVPEQRLVLQARGWPLGEARIELTIDRQQGEALVAIVEDATHGVGRAMPRPLRQVVLGGRNTETLKRLAFLAEARSEPLPGGTDARGSSEVHRT